MNITRVDATALPSDHDREMLRDVLREFLGAYWPAAAAIERGQSAEAVTEIWQQLASQGITTAGSERSEAGLLEIVLIMEELGRAACPALMPGAAVCNLALGRIDQPILRTMLEGLEAGTVRVGLALGEPNAGWSGTPDASDATGREQGDEVSHLIDGGQHATHILGFSASRPEIFIVGRDAPGVVCQSARALGSENWAELRLGPGCRQTRIPIEEEIWRAARLIARLALVARAHGAARRAFDLAVEHSKARHQFGQPIGRFQAVQHKLANNLIALEGVRLTLQHAARAHDLGDEHWSYFAAAAIAYACEALRQTSLETHHVLGALGYAEEHEAPRHFKRVHLDVIAAGGLREARAELAAELLDHPDRSLPDHDLGTSANAFRQEVRAWLARNWPADRKAEFQGRPFSEREFDASFARDLGQTGWLGLSWPTEYGGQARTAREQIALLEEFEKAEAPSRFGAAVQASALMLYGTPEQKARYLPEILEGRAMHGMGYSEPGAGSDLASLKTTATLEDNEWVIRGQKIWTTTWWGQYMFLAARTDRHAWPPHAGISMFIVPMNAPGITIRPAVTMYDGTFANIFYDDVRVPLEAMLGPVNGGWKVLTDALATERGLVGGGIVLKVSHLFNLLCSDLRDDPSLHADPRVRDTVGQIAAEIEVGRQLMMLCAEWAEKGSTPPETAAISKVFSGELMERFAEAVLDLLGPQAALSQQSRSALRGGRYEEALRHSLMWVISIGTNEIQRNLIAQRGLGLPR